MNPLRGRLSPYRSGGYTLPAAMLVIGLAFTAVAIDFAIKSCGGLNIKYSSGSRSGQVQKLSQKGFIWKTWEGELNLGFMEAHAEGSDGHTQLRPAIFYFSVADPAVVESLQKAEISGKRVTLNYDQYLYRGFDKGATSYDVTGVVSK